MQDEEARSYRDCGDQREWLEALYLRNVEAVEDERADWKARFLAHIEEQKLCKKKERAEEEMKTRKRKEKEELEIQDLVDKWRKLEEMPIEKKMKMTKDERQAWGLYTGKELCEEDLIEIEKIRQAVQDRWLEDMIE